MSENNNNGYGICPFNKNHRILLFRMPGHVIKCEQNYYGPPLAICKYNATHRVLPEEMEEHVKHCRDFYIQGFGDMESVDNSRVESEISKEG